MVFLDYLGMGDSVIPEVLISERGRQKEFSVRVLPAIAGFDAGAGGCEECGSFYMLERQGKILPQSFQKEPALWTP